MSKILAGENLSIQCEIISKFKDFFNLFDCIYEKVIAGDISYIKSMLISLDNRSSKNNYQINYANELEYETSIFLIKESLEFWIKVRKDFDQNVIKNIKDHIYKTVLGSYTDKNRLFCIY